MIRPLRGQGSHRTTIRAQELKSSLPSGDPHQVATGDGTRLHAIVAGAAMTWSTSTACGSSPLVIGLDKRLFADGTIPAELKLVDHTVSTTGVVMGTYEPRARSSPGRSRWTDRAPSMRFRECHKDGVDQQPSWCAAASSPRDTHRRRIGLGGPQVEYPVSWAWKANQVGWYLVTRRVGRAAVVRLSAGPVPVGVPGGWCSEGWLPGHW
jgi:hypothetical protein